MALSFQVLNGSYAKAMWEGLGEAEVGAALLSSVLSDKTVQVVGTFGGGTVVIEGSMDGANWVVLNDAQGTPLSFTATALKLIQENPQFVRARVSGGGGTTDIDVLIGARAVA